MNTNWLKKHTRTIALSVGPPTGVSGLALATWLQYGGSAAAVEFAVAATSGGLAVSSFAKKWSGPLSWAATGLALAATQATVTSSAGPSGVTVYAWLVGVGLSTAATAVLNHRTRHDHHRNRIEEIHADTALAQQNVAMARLAMMQNRLAATAPAEPRLTGSNPEEVAVRTALWEVYKTEFPTVSVEKLAGGDGWVAVIGTPPGHPRDTVAKNWDKVSGAMGVPGKFETRSGVLSNQLVVRYQEGDPLTATIPYEVSEASSFLEPVTLGKDAHGDTVTVELCYNHTLIAGSSRFGKSNLMKLIALRLAALPDTVLYGVDMKPGAPELTLLKPVLHDLGQTVEQARALFDWLTQEMHERGEILSKAGDTAWDPKKHGRPAIFVLVDELAELVRQGNRVPKGTKPISEQVESLLALARAYGIQLILGTQQPSNRVFGNSTDARGNLTVRISTRMNDAKHAQYVFSEARFRPGTLDTPGKFLLMSPDHTDGREYKAQFVSDEVAAREVARLGAEMVPAPVGHRAVLPAPAGLNNQEAVRNRLERYGEMSRRELEAGTGLSREQVLRALRELAPEVAQDRASYLWSLRPEETADEAG